MTSTFTAPWILLGGTWHRTRQEQALCTTPGKPSAQAWSDDDVLADMRLAQHGLCAGCEAQAPHKAPWGQDLDQGRPTAVDRLSAAREGQTRTLAGTAKERREARKRRDKKWADAERRDRKGHTVSTSVRTISGGIPSLGKNRY